VQFGADAGTLQVESDSASPPAYFLVDHWRHGNLREVGVTQELCAIEEGAAESSTFK